MTSLEDRFAACLQSCMEQAQAQGVSPGRLAAACEKYGAAAAVREQLRHRRTSDSFDALAQRGLLRLSAEACVADSRFGALFTDAEVNFCYEVLCAAGYYTFG